jgi:hypothetical protein
MSRRAAGVAAGLAAWVAGCGGPAPAPPRPAGPLPVPAAVREKLLDGAVTVLDRLDQFDEAAAYAQVFDRLNQWSHARVGGADAGTADHWTADPLIATLPEPLRALAGEADLASSTFDAAGDVTALRDARWLADIARRVRGGVADDDELAAAVALFRWTTRSLALVSDPPMVPSAAAPGGRWLLPGEILLAGRGSAAQRAWIFLELLRQAGLDGVMLATGDPASGPTRPWLPALISGGEAYLFEPTYGMPVPGPGGAGVATVRQAAADPTVLAALSLPDRAYPVQAGDLAALTALVAADRWSLSRRAAALESELGVAGDWRLTVQPAAVAARAQAAVPGRATAGLWTFPWETLARRRDRQATAALVGRELAPFTVAFAETGGSRGTRQGPRVVRPLLAARIREFRGDIAGPDGAKASYLAARPSKPVIAAAVAAAPPQQAVALQQLYAQMKEDATYWLGVLTLAEGEYEAAVDYLERMTLAAAPDSRWADAARIHLAEAFLALGRREDAVALLRADTSPQRFGSRLRAAAVAAAGPAAEAAGAKLDSSR